MLVGALTAYAQGWFADELSSLANSAGPWSTAAFFVARWQRAVVRGAVVAALCLACCEIGYAAATNVRGGSNATSTMVFWLAAAVLAGPPLGVAGAWSNRTGTLRGIGFGVLAGVLIGEGLYGWATVADTTDWRYWMLETVAGAGLAVWAALQPRTRAGALLTATAAVSTALVVFGAARLV